MNELLPEALKAGIDEKSLLKMTPGAVKRAIEAFWENRKNEWERSEYQSWLSGLYVMNSIASSLSRKHRYPENPMKKTQIAQEDLELTEEQKDYYRDQFMKRLQRMEKRFNKSKEKENGTEILLQNQGGKV